MRVDVQAKGQSPSAPSPHSLSCAEAPRRDRKLHVALLTVFVFGGAASMVGLRPNAELSLDVPPESLHTIGRQDLVVTVTEQGKLESAQNTEIKCKVRGNNTVIWVIESGTEVEEGDVLVRLDTLVIEEEISERTKFAHLAESAEARSKANVARAELAISEYLEGRFVAELATLEKDLAIFESNLSTAKNMLAHARMMAESGYVSELEVEEKEFAVNRAKLDVEVKNTEIDALKKFTRAIELETLRGNLEAAIAMHEADKERAFADAQRRDRALEELEHCVVVASRSGMVIHPKSQKWEDGPDIEEGATVHKDQVLLLMPDLDHMQVKVGVHESVIDRIQTGLSATVRIPDKSLHGRVSFVAPIAQPAGWWTGNVVKYDTIVELPAVAGLKPGMTAEVELILARHENAITIPAAAVVETDDGYFCWVMSHKGTQRRRLQLGDSNELNIVVHSGLAEGEDVIINPLSLIPDAQSDAARAFNALRSAAGKPIDSENADLSQEVADGD